MARVTLAIFVLLFVAVGSTVTAASGVEHPDYPQFQGDEANSSVVSSNGTGVWQIAWVSENSSINVENYTAPKSSPVIYDEVVFMGDDSGEVHAMYLSNGTTKWFTKVTAYEGDGTYDNHGIHSTPAVFDGVVYVGTYDGYLYALDAENGSVVWKFGPIGSAVGSSPHVLKHRTLGDVVYFSGDDEWVYCVRTNGSLAWKTHAASDDMHSSVALDPGRDVLVVGSNDHHVYGLNLTTGETVWAFETGAEVKASPAIDVTTGMAYVGSWDHVVYALDVLTGHQAWNFTTGGKVYSSVAVDPKNDLVVVASYDGELYALNRTSGALAWKYAMFSGSICSPIVDPWNEFAIVGDYGGFVYSVDLLDGRQLWSYPTGGKITSSPAISGDLLVVASQDGRVYAFRSFVAPKTYWSEAFAFLGIGAAAVLGASVLLKHRSSRLQEE
ncbi:MAG: PQQ-binding-like beta-propeller repeat protein [Promethearchaeota archaeon]